ncbi:hypothetical protein RRG08_050530 [Elysia crispata]|uniref:Uncharacterized protein n=1 Tax=Elysia crispata TaxID=231223 RepID=A0AAE1DMU9_9GAST|nr:hypothetical protein RRG08_050530 [Elysia crispata]
MKLEEDRWEEEGPWEGYWFLMGALLSYHSCVTGKTGGASDILGIKLTGSSHPILYGILDGLAGGALNCQTRGEGVKGQT